MTRIEFEEFCKKYPKRRLQIELMSDRQMALATFYRNFFPVTLAAAERVPEIVKRGCDKQVNSIYALINEEPETPLPTRRERLSMQRHIHRRGFVWLCMVNSAKIREMLFP